MTTVNNLLGTYLKELRGDKTLYQLAKEMGIDITQLRRYESGRIPADEILFKLAEFHNVSYVHLKSLTFETLYPIGSPAREALLLWLRSQTQD